MAVTPRIEIKQSQSLLMTPQLRQAINLLQLSNVELNELLARELEHNPFLEREDDRLADAEDGKAPTIDAYPPTGEAPAAGEDFAPDVDCDNEFDDFASDREGYEGGSDYSWDEYAASKTRSPDDEFDFFEKKLSGRKSLYELLDEQISLNFSVPRDKVIASRLTSFLDESGYFRGDTAEIAAKLNLPTEEIEKILSRMQTFEPSGIFARSLSECLAIQLRDNNRLDPQMQKLLDNLDLLGQRKFRELKKICAADDEDLASMIADIRALNPKPAAGYDNDNATCIIPDVFVRTNKQGYYLIELNSMSLPRILINREYYSEIKAGSAKNREARRYLKEQLSHAGFLIKALHQRATTILRVSEEIVRRQRDFFEKGVDYLKPLLLRDIAEALEMHESTVSRVTAHKYMHTPRGIFELKYFFSAAAGTYTGDENTSVVSIRHQIKKLIDEETPENVLSDDKIVELMAQKGIKIARRTVNKYREAMGIPTSAERKRRKRSRF